MSLTRAILAAARGRCPKCGNGALFAGFLRIAPECAVCGEDFRNADSGDGPAFFVMSAVGALVVPIAFILQFAAHWPTWATISAVTVLTIGLSLALLQPFKGVLFALQWVHGAAEGRRADQD